MSRTEDDLIRRTRRVVLATLALLICGLVGSVVWWRWHLDYELNGRLRALQRAGLPTCGAELNHDSIGPDGHDDGGKEPPVGRRGTEPVPEDITITVER